MRSFSYYALMPFGEFWESVERIAFDFFLSQFLSVHTGNNFENFGVGQDDAGHGWSFLVGVFERVLVAFLIVYWIGSRRC